LTELTLISFMKKVKQIYFFRSKLNPIPQVLM
jgi:hypothetical protein